MLLAVPSRLESGCVSIHNSLEFSFIYSSPAYSVDCLCRCLCAPLVVYIDTHTLYALFYTIGQINVTAHYLVPPIVVCFFMMFRFPMCKDIKIFFHYTVARMSNSMAMARFFLSFYLTNIITLSNSNRFCLKTVNVLLRKSGREREKKRTL